MEDKDALHVSNILDFCEDIFDAVKELSITKESFYSSSAQKGVLAFFVEHIGEEASKLSKEYLMAHPEIEWKAVVGFRNRIVHAYVSIDPDVLWDTIQNDIPELYRFCKSQTENE